MRILQLASEAVPFAKTGGLADVVGALCRYLGSQGHRVCLFLPLYRAVREAGFESGREEARLETGVAGSDEVAIRRGESSGPGVEVRFVDSPRLFDRGGLYGASGGDHPDNAERFSTFVRAALAATARLDLDPQVVHCHDWQTALFPAYQRADYKASGNHGSGPRRPPVLLTIHNLAYQGVFPRRVLRPAELRRNREDLAFHGKVSFLKGGLTLADRVSTVSPTYAREIGTPALGFGLDEVIGAIEPPVRGILNGLDTDTWNPATDELIPARFDADDLAGKAACKRELQHEIGLPADDVVPLFGMVSRLVEQKGLALIGSLADDIGAWPAQFVFLGTGEPRYERLLRRLAEANPNVAARIAFSERLAHLVEAGADFFLMPSAFEPCGLNQMISQRYGTLPIVHRTGGLADSVTDASSGALESGTASGLVFKRHHAADLASAIERALALYRQPPVLARMRRAAMGRDFSWHVSGRRYEELYREMRERGSPTGGTSP